MPETEKFNIVKHKPLILLSALDWGLGHTTRCIPIIKTLLGLNCTVVVACNTAQKSLLKNEFPFLKFVALEGYNMHYGAGRGKTILNITLQIPKMLTQIKHENRWLKRFIASNQVDAVISDNRYGFYNKSIPSIFISHQLYIKTGAGNWADHLARRFTHRYIKKFNACWVPDFDGNENIAGVLSKRQNALPFAVKHLGCLSRFEVCKQINSSNMLLCIISGPEPQRTIFEKLLLKELEGYNGNAVLIRGLPGHTANIDTASPNVTILNHVNSIELNKLICNAEMVIARCGYTTVMDLLKLNKKCILIPTPGQAEQEYLADHLHRQQFIFTAPQKSFSLFTAIKNVQRFPFKKINRPMDEYKKPIEEFVESLFNKTGTK